MSSEETAPRAGLLDRTYGSGDAEIANKAVIARCIDAINKGDLDALDGLVEAGYVEHDPAPGQKPGRDGLKQAYAQLRSAFSDVEILVDDVIAEGDLVAIREDVSGTQDGEFLGSAPTGTRVTWTAMRLFRLRNLEVAEGWGNMDMMALMQQIGALPAPPQPNPPAVPPTNGLTGAPSTREANRALFRRFIDEIWNKGNLEVADEIFHPEHTSPSAPTLPPGPEGVKVIVQMFRTAFPDYWMTIDEIVAEDDRVAGRGTQGGTHKGELFGIPPTGKVVKFTEMDLLRIADGKVVETWFNADLFGMMQQLGVAKGA